MSQTTSEFVEHRRHRRKASSTVTERVVAYQPQQPGGEDPSILKLEVQFRAIGYIVLGGDSCRNALLDVLGWNFLGRSFVPPSLLLDRRGTTEKGAREKNEEEKTGD